MIIRLRESKLFTLDPDIRFAREYNLPRGVWNMLYSQYRVLELTNHELCNLYAAKTGKIVSRESIERWVWRTEVYNIAQPALKKGADAVMSSMFGVKELEIIKYIMKNSERFKSKTLI